MDTGTIVIIVGFAIVIAFEIWAAITKKSRTISQRVWAWPKWAKILLAIFMILLFAHLFFNLWR